jgi:hypothetical protein
MLNFVLFNCDNSGVNIKQETYDISGTIEGWTAGTQVLKAMVHDNFNPAVFSTVDSTRIESDGSFVLNLKSPDDNFMYTINYGSDTQCVYNININPNTTKSALLVLHVYDTLNNLIGGVYRSTNPSPIVEGTSVIDLVYCNSNVSITGTIECVYSPTDSVVSNFSLSNNLGWNKLVANFSTFNPNKTVVNYSNNEPAGVKWFYEAFLDNNLKQNTR